MANLHETIDSLNDENVADVKVQLKTAADELDKSNKQLYSRAKKAEGFEQDKDGNWAKKPEPVKKVEKKPESKKQSDELDNTERIDKLTLKSEGVEHSDDIKMVLDEAKRLKLPVEEIINMEHIKSKLKKAQDQREAEDGMPDGRGKSSSGTKDSVEHWVNKKDKDGNFLTPDNLELANKVIDARLKQKKDGNMFSDVKF